MAGIGVVLFVLLGVVLSSPATAATPLADRCRAVVALAPDLLLAEGAGGWLVPLNDRDSMADLAVNLGVDPIALGVIMVINLTLGLLTPPVGLVLSTLAVIGRVDIVTIFRNCWPYFLTLCGVLALCTYVPDVIMFLPRWLMP